jgi:tetratricopeptide (TPR) repeat protein
MFERIGLQGHIGDALNELGQLALCKGDYVEAEDAFRRAHECGRDPVPGLALLRLGQGSGKAAQQMIERALNEDPENKLRRAGLLGAMVTIALANGNVSVAETAVDELTKIAEDFECPVFEAQGVMARGVLELERGNDQAATAELRRALSMFNELALPYDAARTRMLMGRAYLRMGNKEDARLQLDAAVKTFTELGAAADLGIATGLKRQLD